MLLELIGTGIAVLSTGVGTIVGFGIGRKESKIVVPAVDPMEVHAMKQIDAMLDPNKPTIAWAWRTAKETDCGEPGFRCPKCNALNLIDDGKSNLKVLLSRLEGGYQPPRIEHPKICGCDNYLKPHFHFHCGDCKLDTVMKSADDNA